MAYILPFLLLLSSANIAICSSKEIDCAALIDGRDSRKMVPCVVPNPNATSCAAIGCCWNSVAPKLKCFTVDGGKCFVNPVPACKEIINTTLTEHRDTPRFVDNKMGVPVTEMFLRQMMDIVNEQANDKECLKILLSMLCHYTLPPCSSSGEIRLFCKEDCDAVFTKCRDALNKAIGVANYLAKTRKIDFSHINFPNCSLYKPSSYYINKKANETCIKTGFFNFKEEKKTDILPIILPIFFILIIIVSIAVVFIVIRHRRQRNAMKNSKLMLSEGALTMREKLRGESLKGMDLLRLYDPSKVKHYALDNVEYTKDLGEGHFGKVFQGRAVGILEDKPRQETMVAVKALKEGSSKEIKAEFFQEVALMSIFDHPNIVSLIAVSTEEEPYGMIFEYMTGGDLNHYLRNAQPAETSLDRAQDAKVYLSQEDLLKISEQIAAGMEEVAKLKFVHRDLATRNCLVGADLLIKIADFGMSRDIYQSNYYKMSRETLLPIRWLAPEAFLYGKFTSMSDIYSYGVVLWEIYTFGLQPYYGYNNTEVTNFIKQGIHLGKPENCPDYIYTLMKDCWQNVPTDRPDFALIQQRLRDPYGNYDVPKAHSDSLNGAAVERQLSGSEDFGDYDIPKPNADQINMYENPRSPGDVDLSQNYDIPKSQVLEESKLEHQFEKAEKVEIQDKGRSENPDLDCGRRENSEQDRGPRDNLEQDLGRRENSEQNCTPQNKEVSEESRKREEQNRKQKGKPRRNSKQKKEETGKPNVEKTTKEERPSKISNQKREEGRKPNEDLIPQEGQLNEDELNKNTESGKKSKSGSAKKTTTTYTAQPSIEV